MQARLKYCVACEIIRSGNWPEMTVDKHRPPKITKDGSIKFYAWCPKTSKQYQSGIVTKEGAYNGAKRNLETLQSLAAYAGKDLKVVLIVSQPQPVVAKPKDVACANVGSIRKPTTLADVMRARREERTKP